MTGAAGPSGDDETASFVTVRLLAVPLRAWARADEHMDGLLREFALIAASQAHGGGSHPPRQLLDLIAELQQDYSALTSEQQTQLVEAAREGRDAIDLVYLVPPAVADACVRLSEALDAADRFCAEGEHLLSLATPPDALGFRRWYLGEFVRQVGGEPPQSWPDWVAEHGSDGPLAGAPS